MRAWVGGSGFGGEAGWRGVELRREQGRDGAVVKVDSSRRGGVVERWGGEVAKASGRLQGHCNMVKLA